MRNGTLYQYNRTTMSRDELLDFYDKYRGRATLAVIAARLGMRKETMLRALTRARRAGDPRARQQPPDMMQRVNCE
jgi:hypothetical protein